MKKKISLSVLLVALCCLTSFASKPVVTLIAPGEGDVLPIGKAIHFDMDLSDSNMLDTYRVEIHENFDGHAHNNSANEKAYPVIFDQFWDVSDSKSKQVHHHGIVIPNDAKEGTYHFVVTCKNKEGEEATVIRTVVLSKSGWTNYMH